MQLFINSPITPTQTLHIDPIDTIFSIKNKIQDKLNIPCQYQRLIFSGTQLENENKIMDYNIKPYSTIHILLRLCGGVYDPTLASLAKKKNCIKKVCRKCYARLPPRATSCRKKSCGHSNQLRAKKTIK